MTTTKYMRKSVWEKGGGWDNESLYWYAKGIAIMRKLPLKDPKSWGFFGAIHGINMDEFDSKGKPRLTWHQLEDFTEFQKIDIKSLIQINDADKTKNPQGNGFWNQCQHATWYFLPWHRGYLLGIESVLREIIVDQLNGPKDWALPYWDYNDKNYWIDDEKIRIPSAFTDLKFEGADNPLYIKQRYPNKDIKKQNYVDLEGLRNKDTGEIFDLNKLTLESMSSPLFTSISLSQKITIPFFGGSKTTFSHDNNFGTGKIEKYPHNIMHVLIGGQGTLGLMNDPDFAALDPLFYVHHANIDRLWSVWNKTTTHVNPVEAQWLSPNLESPFIVPTSCSEAWSYTPQDLNHESSINLNCIQGYTYTDGFGDRSENLIDTFVSRKQKFGLDQLKEEKSNIELIGATKSKVQIQGSTPVAITIDRDNLSLSKGLSSLGDQIADKLKQSIIPSRIYLFVEGIKGNQEGIILFIRTVEGHNLESIALFGLINASDPQSVHGGSGMNLTLDITDYIDNLYMNKKIYNLTDLNLLLVPVGLRPESKLTIDQISIHQYGS